MALDLFFPCSLYSFRRLQPCLMPQRALCNSISCRLVTCHASTQKMESATVRRSANYHPNIWTHDQLQSLKSDYQGAPFVRQIEKLKEDVRQLLDTVGPLDQLDLIDCMERLGVAYHFKEEIKKILDTIWVGHPDMVLSKQDLQATALSFRLLRQHGYKMSQDVFSIFMDDSGHFEECHCNNIKGMLSLYEASYLSIEGEDILDEAKSFTLKHLKALKGNMDPKLERLVEHSLELPLHWRALRPEARWFIDTYERMEDMNPTLLEFAKLDFNMVQSIYQENLRNCSRWWKKLGLDVKLNFARDRLMESFLWVIGVKFEPQFGRLREVTTKINQMVTTIDDVYDVYGSLDELELFTDAVDRWDTDGMKGLPEYLKTCFLSLYNTVNEIAYDTLLEQGWDVIPYLKGSWANLCKAYMMEAKWYYNGYTPTLDEYLNNAWISISGPVIFSHAYVSLGQMITKEALESIKDGANILRCSSMILRLSDDLGTSTDEQERGDVPKSIQCYMHETGASEAAAREHIKGIISDTWKKMNEDCIAPSPFPEPFTSVAVNLARMSQYIYQDGDGFAVPKRSKDRIISLLVEPIPLTKRALLD